MKKVVAVCLVMICMTVFFSCTQNGKLLIGESENLRQDSLFGVSPESDKEKFLKGVQTFSANLCERAYKYDDSLYGTNTAISPLSVYMALALAVECSQGNTREEILKTLGLSYEQVRAFTGDLYSASIRQKGEDGAVLNEDLTNSVWLQTGLKYNEECLKILSEEYFCSSFETDFAGDNGGANRKIREFVKEKTKGLIDSDFDLDESTYFAIINTLYLKSLWNAGAFDLNETAKKYDFRCQDGSVSAINLLQGAYISGKAVAEQDFSCMYTSAVGCNLYFMVPSGEKSLQDIFTAENIQKTLSFSYNGDDTLRRIHYHTRCLFPSFEASYSGTMNSVLSDWGVKDLFDPLSCDFSPILPDSQTYCGKIIHKTELKVDEKGIEGAAVTVMQNCGMAGPDGWKDEYEEFVVDRAFGYVITDIYNNILFVGTIAK